MCICPGASKCLYCDFNSHEVAGDMPEQRYIDALVADLEASLPLIWGRSVHSIFIGGGTPACFHRRRLTACWATCGRVCALMPIAK